MRVVCQDCLHEFFLDNSTIFNFSPTSNYMVLQFDWSVWVGGWHVYVLTHICVPFGIVWFFSCSVCLLQGKPLSYLNLFSLYLGCYSLWYRSFLLNVDWVIHSVCLMISPSNPIINSLLWFPFDPHNLTILCSSLFSFVRSFTRSSQSYVPSNIAFGRESSGSLTCHFIIAPNLDTAPPPPNTIWKGFFIIPLDYEPTRVHFLGIDVQVLIEENKNSPWWVKLLGIL